MQKKTLLFLLILTSFVVPSYAQVSSVNQLANAFLDTVERHAYRGSLIKWDSIRPVFIEQTRTISDINALEPHFKKILSQLKDGHSGLFFEKVDQNKEAEQELFVRMAGMTDQEAGFPPKVFSHFMTKDHYAYIRIPAVVYEQRRYVDTIGAQLKILDAQQPKGWIIDLTENDGGSIFPMIWHFADLIDVDSTYSVVDRAGVESKQNVRMNNLNDEDQKWAKLFGLEYEQVPPIVIKNKNIPIVLLVSRFTSSSGEFFAAHFKGQKNATVMGQKTGGYTSANEQFAVGNNYMINLATSVIKDRTGKLYGIGEGIKPDIPLAIDFAKVLGIPEIITFDQLRKAVKEATPVYIQMATDYLKKQEL
ncbi:S41 family peptidase [Sphingobacterium sp. HMA12]|uniref:S41 family peptidase n=1 Tax=Sphingobacterium sp. HMA12 TaxID=2050894 RepID=UPI000CEA2DFA|nr:S41 family peptidase [Sphingobacterium sp. HMA12]